MQTILRAVEFLALGLWLGGDTFLSFVVAPGAFAVLANRDSAGQVIGYAFTRLHFAGILLGLLFLGVRWMRTGRFRSLTSATGLSVVLMVVLTGASQFTVGHRMQQLREQMGSVDGTPQDHPLRMEFNRLHSMSVALEGAVLLLGFAGMFFLVREVATEPKV
jgi:uncharacterized membrane protein